MAGAAARIGAQVALPYGMGKAAEAVAPLAQKIKPMLSALPAQSKEVLGDLGSRIKSLVHKGLSETTEAKKFKDAMLADLEQQGIRLPTDSVISVLKEKFVPYAENEMKGLINGLEKASESGSVSLPKYQELVRSARRMARTPAAKDAFGAFNDEFKTSIAKHISENTAGGEVMAQEFLDAFDETAKRLRVFEKMQKIVKDRQAVNIVKGLYYDDTTKAALKAMDEETGVGLLPQVEKLAKEASQIEQRVAERGATAEVNATILQAQKRARAVLYGIAGLTGGAATRSVFGFGGSFTGAEIASWLMSRILGEGGAILPERLAAQGFAGIAKASPAATATAGQVIREEGR
jgi:hypothetical protein